MRARGAVSIAAACVLLGLGGCGGGEGVEEGATVTVYASAPLCAGAKQELARAGGEAGAVRVRVTCLASVASGDGVSLAAIGVNARRATEDSSTIGYIERPDPAVTRFSVPILEEAGIAQVTGSSGAAAMARLLSAVDRAGGSGSLREAVQDELG